MLKKIFLIQILLVVLIVNKTFAANSPIKNNSVAGSAEEICPIKIGQTIPDVKLKTYKGEEFNLVEEISKKPAVIIFYRGTWCPYCNMHLAKLKDAEEKLIEMGYQIIAISADKPEVTYEKIGDEEVKYILLADNNAEASTAFGIAFKVSDKTYNRYVEKNVVDLEKASGNKKHILPVPAVFVVDTEGIIRFNYVNPDFRTRINPNLLLKAAEISLTSK